VNSRTESAGTIVEKPVGRFGSKPLLAAIESLPPARKFWVGFSGGADSTALLLALHRARDSLATPFHAIHFHHGLNPGADAWLDHCRDFCRQRDIPFSSRILDIQRTGGTSIEEKSRDCRYQAVSELLDFDEIYLTAHHADDQAETLFLNLMRGSGVEGLAGIPELRGLARGHVARPLLNWRRSELEAFLLRHGVEWLDDPSNRDESFDRNFLRNNLFPMLESRWPGVVKRLTRSARIARLTSVALETFINSYASDLLGNEHRMPLRALLKLERPIQSLVLRQWLRRQEIPALPEVRIHEFLDQLAASSKDSQAEVRWSQWQLKRDRQFIWLQDISIPADCEKKDWQSGMKLKLGAGLGYLQLHGEPISIPQGWQVDSRREAARIRLRADGRRQALKELLRLSGFPPWMRSGIPVLYWNGEAVAIGDWILGDKMKTWLKSNKLEYCWHPADPMLFELRSACHESTIDP
jgi:tRNA(Ile)-lysidine synthase